MELGAIEREKERDLSSHPGITELQTIMNARTSVLTANLKSPSPGDQPGCQPASECEFSSGGLCTRQALMEAAARGERSRADLGRGRPRDSYT